MQWVSHFVLVPQGGRYDGVLVVMYQNYPLLGAHRHLPNSCQPGLLQDFSEQYIGFCRVVRYQEKCPLEVVRVNLEEFDELVKLNQLARYWFCRTYLFFVEDEKIMSFHLVTVSYLALGILVSLFAEKFVGNRSFAFLVQHSKSDLSL